VATYLSAYQTHLETLMRIGGTPAEMESCVEEYNTAGVPGFLGSPAFEAWVKREPHTCSTCQKVYRDAGEVSATAEQTCSTCRDTKP